MKTAYWWSGHLSHRCAHWCLEFTGHWFFGRGHLEVKWFGDELEHKVPVCVLDGIGHKTWFEREREGAEEIDIRVTG